MSTARDGVQTLVASLFSLPTTSSEDGPLAQLPPPTTQLPRAKPLPKPKPLTKWEQFAKAKGIQHKKKDKKGKDDDAERARALEDDDTDSDDGSRNVADRRSHSEVAQRRQEIKNKILAVGRMQRVFQLLRCVFVVLLVPPPLSCPATVSSCRR